MKNNLLKKFLLILFLVFNFANASDEGGFGLSEEDVNSARKTLSSIRKNIDDAMRKVEDILYPNLQTYDIDTNLLLAQTTIVVDLIGSTVGKTASNSRSIKANYTNYKDNPYIARLAVIETGLRVQMKFIDSVTGVTDSQVATSGKVPLFEPFYGKRIVMVPIFNVTYDTSGNVTAKDQEITGWECLSDADEAIGSSSTGISEGMRSVVSLAGGRLGSCQYISVANMNTIWASI